MIRNADPEPRIPNPENMAVTNAPPPRRDKLGLALAGGGFRASLFHLGVLRRMAELDLLRFVEVLSTVSGGSIIGALYVLLLKRRLDQRANLSRDDYLEIVRELQERLTAAIQKNLRTRLFWNPLGILRVLLTEHTLGKRMSRLYERHLYRGVVEQLRQDSWWQTLWRPGKILLRAVRFSPGGQQITQGIEAYNANAANTSKVPNLILNATSLNSGRPFRFSSVELADPKLGGFRYDEFESELRPRKLLLQTLTPQRLRQAVNAAATSPRVTIDGVTCDSEMVRHAAWWRAYRNGEPPPFTPNIVAKVPELLDPFATAEFGLLRRAKIPAWYARRGPHQPVPVTGGVGSDVHMSRFWDALQAIDDDITLTLRTAVTANPALEAELLDFILQLYYLRTSEIVSPRFDRDWTRLALAEAVGASACFPPVFPPFIVLGIYDDLWVSRLGLTDGGVYDNVGIMALLEEDCTYVIASDTSGLFDVEQRVSAGRLRMSARITNTMMDNVAELQRTLLRQRRRVSDAIDGVAGPPSLTQLQTAYDLRGLAFFHIDSRALPGPGLGLNLDHDALARIRTDLDAFGAVEIAALVNHGYDTADRYIRKYLSQPPFVNAHWVPATAAPLPLVPPPEWVQRVLRAGHSRFFRALKLLAPVSLLFTAVVLLAAIVHMEHATVHP